MANGFVPSISDKPTPDGSSDNIVNLKFLWGFNSDLPTTKTNGKAYFAVRDDNYPSAAPANEAFIYFDKDNTRYNVIAKRAIFDALGNKINSTYATDIESSGNTMSLFSADGGEAIDSATIINSLSLSTGTQNSSKYSMKVTVNGQDSSEYSLAAAASDKCGIVTTGEQSFGGAKTFTGTIHVTDTTVSPIPTMGAVVIDGGLGVGDNICAAGNLFLDNNAMIGGTLTTGGAASIGGDLTVVGKDIYFGNETGKIVAITASADGSATVLKNTANTAHMLQIASAGGSTVALELWRGNSSSSWKMQIDGGHLKFYNNYTTAVGDYYSILTLAYNTGDATLKGKLTADTITIGNTSGVHHLSFSRGNLNYITAPASGKIAFIINGKGLSEANAELIIQDGSLRPGTTNVVSLGSTNYNYSNAYARALTSADALSITSAASKAITFTQGTTQVGQFDTAGSLKITNNIYPTVNNTKTLGTASAYWNHVYSTNFTGTTFTGDTFTGNAASATKVYVTDTAAPTETTDTYRILFSNGSTSNNQDVRFYDSLTYTIAPGILGSVLTIGGNRKGGLQLSDGNDKFVTIRSVSLTSNRTITISDAGGTMMTSGNYTEWASPRNHTHNVTISHTPAGTISKPTFTGTANQETSANAGYSAVASSGHTHSYNRVSSVSGHSLSTSSYTSSTNSGSGVAFYAYSGSSKPSLTASISSKCLTVTFTSPATSAYTVAPNAHTHSYNRVSSISNHTVSTSSYTSGTPSATTDVASNGHKHTYTAAGTISTPTFTGTAYSTTETTTTQNV